jgi:hypothetical protein
MSILEIYDIYFDDDYIDNDIMYNDYNGRDNVINGLLIDNLEVECK